MVSKTEKLLLQARIAECKDRLKQLRNDAFFARRHLEECYPDEVALIQLHANFQASLQNRKNEHVHENKLEKLRGRRAATCPQAPRNAVHILSSYQPTEAELSVLGLGLNFNMGPAPDPRKVVCAVEQAVSLVEPSLRDEARTRAVSVLSKLRAKPEVFPLSESECAAVRSLRDNEEIVVLPADKGNVTVVMDAEEYSTKMLALLGDAGTYASLGKDPTQKVQQELQKLLADVFHAVPPQHKGLYYKLLCHNGSAPAIYGLPKLHKPGVPLRPIVDFTRSPLHRLPASRRLPTRRKQPSPSPQQ